MEAKNSVEVTNININFFRMVALMIKLSFAAIPATIVIVLIWTVLAGIFVGAFGGIIR